MDLEKQYSIEQIVKFIEHIYETVNIYHTLILYDDSVIKANVLNDLINRLEKKDFPVGVYKDKDNDIDILELHSRVIILDKKHFYTYVEKKNNDLTNITIMLCMDSISGKILHDKLNENVDKIRFAEKMYIFSCNKV